MVQRRRNKRWIGWVFLLVLVIAAIVVVVLVNNNFFGEKNKEESRIDSGVSKQEEPKNTNTTANEAEKTEETKKDVPQYSGDNPNEADSLSGVVSYADVNSGELIIRVNINQFLSTGSCKLNITKNGANVYSEEVNIEESVSTSTCNGFKIPVNNLTSGDLQIEIELESEGKTGRINGKVRI